MTISDLLLEQYRLGELAEADVRRVDAALEADSGVRERLRAIDESDAAIRLRYPPPWIAQRVRARARPRPRGAAAWRSPIAAAALAVAILAITRAIVAPDPRVAPATADRIKGLQPALTLYRRTAAGSETLADGSIVRAGDLLRLGYRAAGRGYGMILSIDGRAVVTVHLPSGADRAAPLVHSGATLLDHAYELDDAPGWERFYFITADTPFAVAPVVETARKAATGAGGRPPSVLPLSRELAQSAISVQKEVRQ